MDTPPKGTIHIMIFSGTTVQANNGIQNKHKPTKINWSAAGGKPELGRHNARSQSPPKSILDATSNSAN